MDPLTLLFYLVVWHALADFALQGDWLQRAKNHRRAEGRETDGFAPVWPLALAAHGVIHAGGVAFLTGSVLLGLLELMAHAAIDYLKSDGRFGLYADQLLHLLCKALWVFMVVSFGPGGEPGL